MIRKHGPASGDPLFTEKGWTAYADDLLSRMTNPWLHDRVDRIIRDPVRKLGWNDRFFGAMRVALEQGVRPQGTALGAAAALSYARKEARDQSSPKDLLLRIWGRDAAGDVRDACLELVEEAAEKLPGWSA